MLVQFLTPDFISDGERGKLVQLVHDGYRQVNVITSVGGSERGGHCHQYNQECFYVISGSFRLTVWQGMQQEEHLISKGQMFAIPTFVFHTFHYLSDTVLVSMYSSGVELSPTQMDIWTE